MRETHLSKSIVSLVSNLWTRFELLIRFGAVGLINTAFGYGLYALLVFVGLNLFVAQICSHCIGAAFNYFMFQRHVFSKKKGSVFRYIGAYAFNYALGVTFLAIYHSFIPSPYLAGFVALLTTAVLNFFVLRFLVFTRPRETT